MKLLVISMWSQHASRRNKKIAEDFTKKRKIIQSSLSFNWQDFFKKQNHTGVK